MIGYATLGMNTCDEAARFCFRDLDGNKLNAFRMHEADS
jgi:hypothetical protein